MSFLFYLVTNELIFKKVEEEERKEVQNRGVPLYLLNIKPLSGDECTRIREINVYVPPPVEVAISHCTDVREKEGDSENQ